MVRWMAAGLVVALAGCTVTEGPHVRVSCGADWECGKGWVCLMTEGVTVGVCDPRGPFAAGGPDAAFVDAAAVVDAPGRGGADAIQGGGPNGGACEADTACGEYEACDPVVGDCVGVMADVPAGVFRMGCNGALHWWECQPDEEPRHEVTLSAYRIDMVEVTVDAYARCVAAGSCTVPGTWDSHCNWGADGKGQHPVNCMTWFDAKGYCAWAGKRLCTEAEWEKAARGGCEVVSEGNCSGMTPDYPWGDESPTCTYAVMPSYGGFGCGLDSTWPVGSKPLGASPYGALDMAGNLWEWVYDQYSPTYYAVSPSSNPHGPASGTGRTIRGGGYSADGDGMRAAGRDFEVPTASFIYLGFRCCKAAP